jgi:4a-hydroxytetrahydrobiopterin dehydratase
VSTLPAHCTPCRKGTPSLTRAEAEERLRHVPDWTLDFPRLRREFRLADFRGALAWTNRVGALAEQEDHHPDFHLTGWNRVELVLSTHAIGGLSDNDFVLARAIDRAWGSSEDGPGSSSPR